MSAHLVSVIIPVYNGESMLGSAIESAFAQDYDALEIVVVDDGSTDNSSSVAASYPGVLLIHQSNQGVAAARNVGIRASRGEFLAFLDADDIWLPNKIGRQIETMTSSPEIGYCICLQRQFLDPSLRKPPAWVRPEHLEREHVACVPSALVVRRRVLLDAVGLFDQRFRTGEDSDWFLRAREADVPMTVVKETLLLKRIHDSNLTGRAGGHASLFGVLRSSINRRKTMPDRGEGVPMT